MTEAQWLASDSLRPMLKLVGKKANGRKLRLFACACARRVWGRITPKVSRRAVEVAEQFEDHAATVEVLRVARAALRRYLYRRVGFSDGASTAYYTTVEDASACARETAAFAQETAAFRTNVDAVALEKGRSAEQRQQCDLLRCVFGPAPFRALPRLNPAWLAWEAGTVPKLAAAVYEGRAFDRLPILADALEDAGCTEAELLTHLRGPGRHVRGCWVVDLLLGKQ
jgi:hypothetical protein